MIIKIEIFRMILEFKFRNIQNSGKFPIFLDPSYNLIVKVARHTPCGVTEFTVCRVNLLFLFIEVPIGSVRVACSLSLTSDETLSGILKWTNLAAVTMY